MNPMPKTPAIVTWCLLLLVGLAPSAESMATEAAFDMIPVGEVQVRELPPARLLVTEADGAYFDRSNQLFGRLFEYIKSNEIAMTVPVEGDLNRASMRFYVGSQSPEKLADSASVRVVEVSARTVAGIGGRGAYGESNLRQALDQLTVWLEAQDEWRATGEPYAVFWNGPFTPWFVKRFEVHMPVEANTR